MRLSGCDIASCEKHLLDRPAISGHICKRDFLDSAGQTIDTGIALRFTTPNSFTGEDVLELHGHGGTAVIRRLLQRCVELGARIAEPGEFSKRAYINGKLDLAQAESVADLINSTTERRAKLAIASLRGELSSRANALANQILDIRAHVEAAIDFSDEDISVNSLQEIRGKINQMIENHQNFLTECKSSIAIGSRANVTLIGAPNVGKSSLLNALCVAPLAIVDDKPGTTRDVVTATSQLDGMEVIFNDTAGLRQSTNVVEREGMRRANLARNDADIVIQVHDITQPAKRLRAQLHVFNKIDLSGQAPHSSNDEVFVSAITGAGIDILRSQISRLLNGTGEEPTFLARERHAQAIENSLKSLIAARRDDVYLEEMAEHLRIAHNEISKITGSSHVEDLLGEIFAQFCIGK